MKRTNVFLPEQMLERLKAAQAKLGIPVAEIIRRAVDEFLKKMKL
jgi:predicted DNA-binding protein